MARIGIDLGTTTSLASVYRNGKVELIPNKFGNFTTPSVVSVDESGNIIVGEIAKERLISNPESTKASFKKDMGTNAVYELGGMTVTPEELSSFVIASLVEDAQNYLGEPIEEAVISVPAYFQDKQRVATKNAGLRLGIKVDRIINEPSAAALTAYLDKGKEEKFLIFDLGGGTLDISIVDCFQNLIEIVSVSGDNKLGGDDFNRVIADSILKEHGISGAELNREESAILLKLAEKAKLELSCRQQSVIRWSYRDAVYESVMDNQRLIEDGAILLGKIKNVIAHALRDGEFQASDMDAVICAGGSGQMPTVQAYLRHLFPSTPLICENPQEMIARGLGNILGIMDRESDIKDYIMTDICPFSLGIETAEDGASKTVMTSIIVRNTALPCSREKTFYTTYDGQTEVKINILQGENYFAGDNHSLGVLRVKVLGKPAGQESIRVRFTYDINGILEVDVNVPSTGKNISRVFSGELSEEEIAETRKKLKKLKHHPGEQAENILLKEKLLSAYAIHQNATKEYLGKLINTFDSVLEDQNGRKIRAYRDYVTSVLGQIENIDPFYRESFEWDEEE